MGDVNILINAGRVSQISGGGQKFSALPVTQNIVRDVRITVNGGEFYGTSIIAAGGTDAVSVGHSVVTINSGNIAYVYASGSNGGFVNESVLNLNGGKITNLLGIVRGYLGNTTVNVNGSEIVNMFAGNDNDPSDDGIIKKAELNILSGSVDTLLKGFSHVIEDFVCAGTYAKGVIGNETAAVAACNLVCKEIVDGYGNNLNDIANAIVWEPIA